MLCVVLFVLLFNIFWTWKQKKKVKILISFLNSKNVCYYIFLQFIKFLYFQLIQ